MPPATTRSCRKVMSDALASSAERESCQTMCPRHCSCGCSAIASPVQRKDRRLNSSREERLGIRWRRPSRGGGTGDNQSDHSPPVSVIHSAMVSVARWTSLLETSKTRVGRWTRQSGGATTVARAERL
jgi:hypothetical protein